MDGLQFRSFDPKTMVRNPAILTIAKRGSGKSFLIRDIMYCLDTFFDVPAGIIISVTEKLNSFYAPFFPDVYIHHEAREDIFKQILFRQTEIIAKSKHKAKNGLKVDPRAVLVMDDCLGNNDWKNMNSMREILFNGRHYMLTYILAIQYSKGIGPDLRGNFDYIFLLNEDFQSNLKRLYEEYAGMFPNYYVFYQVFKKCTEDYKCMVIDNRKPDANIKNKVFWFKATDRPEFKFGCSKFRQYHHKVFDPNYLRRTTKKSMDYMNMFRKKGAPQIKVIME